MRTCFSEAITYVSVDVIQPAISLVPFVPARRFRIAKGVPIRSEPSDVYQPHIAYGTRWQGVSARPTWSVLAYACAGGGRSPHRLDGLHARAPSEAKRFRRFIKEQFLAMTVCARTAKSGHHKDLQPAQSRSDGRGLRPSLAEGGEKACPAAYTRLWAK